MASHVQGERHVFVIDHVELLEGPAHARREQADLADRRHEAAEDRAAQRARHLGFAHHLRAGLLRIAERLPDVVRAQVLVQHRCALAHEFLALLHLGGRHVRIHAGEREPADREMARLVALDAREQILDERIGAERDDGLESRQRDSLDEHLHAEVRDVERARRDGVLQQPFERAAHRVAHADLLVDELRVRLDVARLVHDLRGRAQARGQALLGARELRCADERRLLAVQDLRQQPSLPVMAHLRALGRAELVPQIGAEHEQHPVGHAERIVGVERHVPVDVAVDVPLGGLRLVVQVRERGLAVFVIAHHQRVDGHRPALAAGGVFVRLHSGFHGRLGEAGGRPRGLAGGGGVGGGAREADRVARPVAQQRGLQRVEPALARARERERVVARVIEIAANPVDDADARLRLDARPERHLRVEAAADQHARVEQVRGQRAVVRHAEPDEHARLGAERLPQRIDELRHEAHVLRVIEQHGRRRIRLIRGEARVIVGGRGGDAVARRAHEHRRAGRAFEPVAAQGEGRHAVSSRRKRAAAS
ncbi:hypothetical protein BURPS1710b_0713 [Burkholderia pseudomallei 1710b]|uniref:Uncharacterized protein n=1 Tax=Burkholderia pseudomallei (strain 1710b) TaxID=320372 RepID=Q3JWC7_BURP1|nr:hypothetical protein BURPS1710b_0713 [Burkholderia pseudomallei 1710b]